MKPRKRDKLDDRIGRALKSGMLDQPPPVGSRHQLLQSAAAGPGATARREGWGVRRSRSTPSSERRREREQVALQGRKYGYIVVTANFRLAW